MRSFGRVIIAAVLTFILANSAVAVDLGVLITTENALFPIVCLDSSGHSRIDVDSFHVEVVKHDASESGGDLALSYSASGDTTAAWVTRSLPNGDSTWWFRDAIADIDGNAGNGQYTGAVKAYKFGKETITPFSFYLTTTSFTTLIEKLASLTFTVAGVVDANMTHYEGVTGVDAEIQSEVEDGINAATDINTIITEVTNLDGGTLPWNATTMDSVLNALDYTNNPKHVYRRLDIDSALIPAIKAKTDQMTFGTLGINSNVADWGDFGATIVTGAGNYPSVESNTIANGAINSLTFANNAIGSAALSGTAAKETADSVWKAGIKGTQTGDADSTFADAFINTGGQAYAIVDFDTSGGTLSDAQIDDITVNIKADDTVTVVNNVLNVNSTDTLARVNSTDAGDTLRAHAPHGNNFASTGSSACAGSGIVTCTLFVANGAGALGGVGIELYTSDGSSATGHAATSNDNGFVYFNIDASTTYAVKALPEPGSVHDSLPYQTLAVGAVTHIRDTVPITTTTIPAPSSATVKRIYDYIYSFVADSLRGVTVRAELVLPDSTVVPYDTSTGVSLGKNAVPVTAITASSGLWYMDVIPNNYIRPAGSRYKITATYNGRIVYSVMITANGTTTALVRDLQ